MRTLAAASLAALALATVASLPLTAQSDPGPELRSDALQAVEDGTPYGEAARTLVEDAAVMAPDDRERARTLRLAAVLYDHAGEPDRSHWTLLKAGKIAHNAGDGELAVRLFLDAAQAATEAGNPQTAWRAGEYAGKVILAEEFTYQQQRQLLARLDHYPDAPPTLAMPGGLARP